MTTPAPPTEHLPRIAGISYIRIEQGNGWAWPLHRWHVEADKPGWTWCSRFIEDQEAERHENPTGTLCKSCLAAVRDE